MTKEDYMDSQDHSISFSWNRIRTPPTDDEKNKHDMIQNVVMNTRSAETQSVATPRKRKKTDDVWKWIETKPFKE